MSINPFLRGTCAFALIAALNAPILAAANEPIVQVQPRTTPAIAGYVSQPDSAPLSAKLALLRKKVKYVFVIFQENRSFDSYFGSFPGAHNLFSQPPEQTPGFYQTLLDTNGNPLTIHPFRIGPAQQAADTDDVDHSFVRMSAKMNYYGGVAHMNRYASTEELKYTTPGANPSLKALQYGELTMAYEDCDTIPFLWNYANRFTLFDNYFQHTIGPSTPNAIDMVAGQTGETQWVRHPNEASNNPILAALGQGEPIVTDNDPFWGSAAAPGLPINPGDNSHSYALNQTYASLPLTFNGQDIKTITGFDTMKATDLADVSRDISAIAALKANSVPWGWFQEGYDHEPTDPTTTATHLSYIGHHNGPQYFGYVANNAHINSNLHGLNDFFTAMSGSGLPAQGGVFYLRGGYENIDGLAPADPDPAVQANFSGDDDHPGYSDAAISEALVAREVNAIASSKYWSQSAIFITYDESEGDYDHVPPYIQTFSPAGLPLVHGPRIPMIVVSPYANAHVVSHESGDHNSLIRFIDQLFGLPYLADLPEEAAAIATGRKYYGQQYLGPDDDGNPFNSDLLTGFDYGRLSGRVAPLPPAYAMIPAQYLTVAPFNNQGCAALGIIPDDIAKGIVNVIPPGFNPRPSTDPTATSAPAASVPGAAPKP